MLRSLWAGVSGLQAHQIAMDVEGNNIANVNTAGFKYSRANFSDLLSQTSKIATAPQGDLGGKNPMQIGLGTQIASVTKIFKQGSVQVTDKNTDLAIQGDGFFVVSPDGGSTYKYSRNGDFNFDALGNFTDGNGYIIQGWMKDEATGAIDATTPIQNIIIPPGLTTPANDSSYIALKANLNAGTTVVNKSTIYSLDQHAGWVDVNGDGMQDLSTTETHDENGTSSTDAIFNANRKLYERGEDIASLFNSAGETFGISNGQGIWVSYDDSTYSSTTVSSAINTQITVDMTINGTQIGGPTQSYTSPSTTVSNVQEDNMRYIQDLINQNSTITGVEASIGAGGIILTNTNQLGTESDMKNIDLTLNVGDDTGLLGGIDTNVNIITAFQYVYTSSTAGSSTDRADAREFKTTEDLRSKMQEDARLNTDYTGSGWDNAAEIFTNINDGVNVIVNAQGQFEMTNATGDAFNSDDGDVTTSVDANGNPWTLNSANLTTAGTFIMSTGTAIGANATAGTVELNTITLSSAYTMPAGTTYTVDGVTKTASQEDMYDLAGVVENGDIYSMQIDGLSPVPYTVVAGDLTKADVAAHLADAINADTSSAAIVIASTNAAGQLLLTAVDPLVTFTTTSSVTNRGDATPAATVTETTPPTAARAQEEQTVLDVNLRDGDVISIDLGAGVISTAFDATNPAMDSSDEVMTAFAALLNAQTTTSGGGITASYAAGTKTLTMTADAVNDPFTVTTDFAVAHNASPDATASVTTVAPTAGTAQIDTLAVDLSLRDGNTITVDVQGTTYSSTFDATNTLLDTHDEVMADLATKINVDTAAGPAHDVAASFTPGDLFITLTAQTNNVAKTINNEAVTEAAPGTATAGAGTDVTSLAGVPEITTVAITAPVGGANIGDVYTLDLDSANAISYTAVRGDTATSIATGLAALYNADANLTAKMTLSDDGAGTLTLTETGGTSANGGHVVNFTPTTDAAPDLQTFTQNSTAPSSFTVAAGTLISSINIGDGGSITLPAGSTYIDITTNNAVLTESTFFPAGSVLVDTASGDSITLSADIILPEGAEYDLNAGAGVETVAAGTTITIPLGTILTHLKAAPASGLTLAAGTSFTNTATEVSAGTDTRTAQDFSINLAVTGLSNAAEKISENVAFATTIKTIQGALPSGNNVKSTQSLYAASHASSIDVYDSLGSKHTVRIEFRKVEVSSEGTIWNTIITVPEPGVINSTGFPANIITGNITFGPDGALVGSNPQTIAYSPNNGASGNQAISLEFGTAGQFDGMTSYDAQSDTTGIYQDGFPGGDLAGIRVDETGTLVGSFTNGRSFGLAQVAMAKFTNNNALESDGGNTFIQTSNSGEPIIGQAAVGGRGFIQASALEMSNVDLSRSLTQLIIIQRGFQANSKTITTSDQMLNTLLQLKQ